MSTYDTTLYSTLPLDCGVCLEPYDAVSPPRQPRSLGCGHTLCTACLKGMRERFHERWACPLCSKQIVVADNNSLLPPLNFILVDTLHSLRPPSSSSSSSTSSSSSSSSAYAAHVLDICGVSEPTQCREEAVVYCDNDQVAFCAFHAQQQHATAILRRHRLVPINDAVPPSLCVLHRIRKDQHCMECDVLLCGVCADFDTFHAQHNIMPIGPRIRDEKRRIKALHETLLHQKAVIDAARNKAEAQHAATTTQQQMMAQRLSSTCQSLFSALRIVEQTARCALQAHASSAATAHAALLTDLAAKHDAANKQLKASRAFLDQVCEQNVNIPPVHDDTSLKTCAASKQFLQHIKSHVQTLENAVQQCHINTETPATTTTNSSSSSASSLSSSSSSSSASSSSSSSSSSSFSYPHLDMPHMTPSHIEHIKQQIELLATINIQHININSTDNDEKTEEKLP